MVNGNDNYVVTNEIVPHTFLLKVEILSDKLNLKRLAKEFELDVQLSNNRTKIVQGDHVVDQAFEICSTRSKNKRIDENNADGYIPTGFRKITLPKNPDTLVYSRPPEMIPIGCYCISCKNAGPFAHSIKCSRPKKMSLYLTLEGFVNSIYTGKYSLNENSGLEIDQEIDQLMGLIDKISQNPGKKRKNKKIPVNELKNLLKEMDDTVFDKLFTTESKEYLKMEKDILTRIPLSSILPLTKTEKEGKFFAGPVMITYNRGNGKNVTIRVRGNSSESGTSLIELISNPWSEKDLYKKVIDRINDTSQKVKYGGGEVRTLFSSVKLLQDSCDKKFDLKKIFNYLWPVNEANEPVAKYPKENLEFEDGDDPYWYIKYKNNLYRYKMWPDKKSNARLFAELITCEIQNDDEEQSLISGPYKISVQLFSQGHLQLTFGYCKESDDCDAEKPHLETIQDQFDEIKSIFKNIQLMFCHYISELVEKDPKALIDVPQKLVSKKIFNTRLGILPYAKRKKFRKGDKVELFDYKNMTWSGKYGKIVDQDSDKNYIIEIKTKDKETGSKKKVQKTYSHNDLRRIESNNDQVCRAKENGIPKQPVPYSFYGSCPGGANQIIKPIGTISRADNRRYPTCTEIKKGDREWTLNFLMDGLTDEEIEDGSIEKMVVEINSDKKKVQIPTDHFSGTFKPGTTDIGANIIVKNNNEFVSVIIMDKYKTHGRGNDSNEVIYKVQDSDNNEFEVSGKDFHPSFVESRDFRGLNNMIPDTDEQKNVLLKCAEKLNLVRPNLLKSEDPTKIQLKVLKHVAKLMGTDDVFNYFGRESLSVNGKSIKKYMAGKMSFVAAVVPAIPRQTLRCLLCILSDGQYLIDMNMKVMKVSVNTSCLKSDKEIIIDGFAKKVNKSIVYYPIDLLFNGSVVKKSFVDYERNNGDNKNGSGRLADMLKIISQISAHPGTNGIIIQNPMGTTKNRFEDKFIGPTNPGEKGLISFVRDRMQMNPDSTIVFIPTSGVSRYLQWADIKRNTVVVQLINKVKNNYWSIGLVRSKNGKIQRAVQPNLDYTIRLDNLKDAKGNNVEPALYDYIRIKINVMKDGSLNPLPIIEPVKMTTDDFLGYETTKRIIQSILYPVKKEMFLSNPWTVPSSQIILKEKAFDKPLYIDN